MNTPYFSFLICCHPDVAGVYLNGLPIGEIRDGKFHGQEFNLPEGFETLYQLKQRLVYVISKMNPSEPETPCRCGRCLTERGAIKTFSMTGHDLTTMPTGGEFVGMIVCETCGNKRCPHATDHRHECTDSNSPGQAGSIYA